MTSPAAAPANPTTACILSDDPELDRAARNVEDRMSEIARTIRLALRDAAASVDPELQPMGFKLMRILERQGPSGAGALADQIGIAKSVLSRLSKHLDELGFVQSQPDPLDRRNRTLSLTELGAERMGAISPTSHHRMRRVLLEWSVTDLDQFAGHLARLMDADQAQEQAPLA